MYAKLKVLGPILLLLVGILLPGYRASATVEVVTGFVSERKTTFITLNHEDASPMARLVSDLSQNVDAIDNVFTRLQHRGVLQSAHSTLVIAISDDAYQGLLPESVSDGFAVLSLKDNYRLDLDPQGVAADLGLVGSVNLGPVYLVEVALWPITVDELLALVFRLPELSSENPRLELSASDIRQHRSRFEIERLTEEWSSNDLLWSPDGRMLLVGAWHNRRLSYRLYDFVAKRRTLLEPIHLSIMPPTFSPDSHYVVSVSNHELRITDIRRQHTWRVSFAEMIPEQLALISTASFAVNNRGDTLFFSLFGYGMESELTLVWRSQEPRKLERVTGLGHMEKPQLPGEDVWSDFVARRHPSAIWNVREFTSVARELAVDKEAALTPLQQQLKDRYGAFYAEVENLTKDRLALLADDEGRLTARVLALPSLEEIDVSAFTLMPESRRLIPGTIAGVSLFNVGVVGLILLMALGISKLLGVVAKKHSRGKGMLAYIRKRRLTFVCALLITLVLHLLASIATLIVVHDSLQEEARRIAEEDLAKSYSAGLGYRVEVTGGVWMSFVGSSPLVFFDFPYQVLYWHALGRDAFATPIRLTLRYNLFDHLGNLVSREERHFNVLGASKVFRE